LVIGAKNQNDISSARFGVLNNGTIHIDGGPYGGRWAFKEKEFLCYESKATNATESWSLSGGLQDDGVTNTYAQFLTIKIQ
jgi:hypothetical protein